MCAGAGTKPAAIALTAENICGEIFKANTALDNAEVPETGRIIVVTPDTYLLMKQSKDIFLETDVAENMRLRGVIAQLDGAQIIKVPANRLPSDFGFMIAHPWQPWPLPSWRITGYTKTRPAFLVIWWKAVSVTMPLCWITRRRLSIIRP